MTCPPASHVRSKHMTNPTAQQLLDEAAALRAKADELLAQAAKMEEEEVAGVQWPRQYGGEHYYFHYEDKTLGCSKDKESLIDNGFYEVGNYFLNKEDAEYYSKLWAARQRFDRMAEVLNATASSGGRWIPKEGKVYYVLSRDANRIIIGDSDCYYQGVPVFKTEEAAQRCLDAMSDEDKLILFGVK